MYKIIKTDTVEYSKVSNKKTASVKIPDKVKLNGKTYKITSVGKGMFQNCKKLKSVVIGKNAFKKIYAKAVIKAPKAKRKAYRKLLRAGGAGSKVRIK